MRLLAILLATGVIADTADAQIRIQVGPGGVRAIRPAQPQFVFGARRHLDEQAASLEYQLKLVCLEMHHHYQGNPHFRETYAEAYEMWQTAGHIHELIHDKYHHTRHDDDHIAADLGELDELFHHVEDDIAAWRPTRGVHHHRGTDLHSRMENAEKVLHHLMDDYGTRSKFGNTNPPPPGATEPPPPGGFNPRR